MIVRRSLRPLPRIFKTHRHARGLVLEKDVHVGGSRLAFKLLIFKTRDDLRDFWRKAVKPDDRLEKGCDGVVHALWIEKQTYDEQGKLTKSVLIVNPRYFALMAITEARIGSAEVNAHEAVHAAFAFSKRVRKTPWDRDIKRCDEEMIAYPTGLIAKALANIFWKHFHESRH